MWNSKLRLWLSTLAAVLIVGGVLMLSLFAVKQQQSTTSRAASCNEAPVNVEFRKNARADTPWKSGKSIEVEVGDVVEVNCFSKAGTALLTNGQITATRDGVEVDVEQLSSYYDGVQVRGFTITQPGEYTFKCTNGARCTNSDTFTVSGVAASPSPTPGASPQPTPCSSPTVSDLNKDCRSTIDDYDLFLRDFIDQQE